MAFKFGILKDIRNFEFKKSEVSHTATIITSIPPGGILIDRPGTYKFANDINWTPIGLLNIGITIIASDVTLDLSCHTFRCLANNLLSIGIFAFNCNNINIKNGTVQNMGLISVGSLLVNNLNLCDLCICGLTPPFGPTRRQVAPTPGVRAAVALLPART